MNLKTTIFASALLFSSLFAKIQHLCISHHRLCWLPHQLQIPRFEIKFCVNSVEGASTKQVQSPEWLRLVWELGGRNAGNALNGKKARLKYYEWENMVVWNLSLCVRFEQMLAIFSDKKWKKAKIQGLHNQGGSNEANIQFSQSQANSSLIRFDFGSLVVSVHLSIRMRY